MNNLKTMFSAACMLILVNVSTAIADSSNFAGPYVGLTLMATGAEIAGEAVTGGTVKADGPSINTKTDDERTTVNVGKVMPISGIEIGYAIPVGGSFLIDIGGLYQHGSAKIETISDVNAGAGGSKGNVSFTVEDFVTGYIAPTIVLSDTSSLYVKVGLTQAQTGTDGDVTQPGNLSGTTWGIGTRTVLPSGIFIRTEAGYTEYNELSAHGCNGCGNGKVIPTTNRYSAEPTTVHGSISMGLRF